MEAVQELLSVLSAANPVFDGAEGPDGTYADLKSADVESLKALAKRNDEAIGLWTGTGVPLAAAVGR